MRPEHILQDHIVDCKYFSLGTAPVTIFIVLERECMTRAETVWTVHFLRSIFLFTVFLCSEIQVLPPKQNNTSTSKHFVLNFQEISLSIPRWFLIRWLSVAWKPKSGMVAQR